ncbi:MAG: ROK family transcriptional regulator [Spirochaetales bacterium]|nr:ROK family transcriptional regulator [Spirochaetales bacterium]
MATQSELFKNNISQVLRCIWLHEGISRVDISKELQMDKSTVTKIVSYLLDIDVIKTEDEGEAKVTGGRKPVPLSINVDFGCIIGIEIQTDSYIGVITNLRGEVISLQSNKMDYSNMDLVESFCKIVDELKPFTAPYDLLGIVLGLSGIINPFDGVVIKSNPMNIYEEYKFVEKIKEKTDIPVLIENDANCCCWGELTSLKRERPRNMIFILGEFREVETHHAYYPGIGFGFGIVIDGKVYYGSEFSAGEFKSLFSKAPSVSQFSLQDSDIENIQNKPEELMKLLRELCVNVSLVINFFNINEIIIGGAVEQYYDIISLMLSQEIQRNWLYPGQMTYNIVTSNQSQKSVAYGAACMFLERLFGIPDINSSTHEVLQGVELLEKLKLIHIKE